MSFADLMRLHGHRNGRPGAPSSAERARILRDATLDELLAAGMCECGQPLDGHLPVPMPPPIASWASARRLDAAKITGRRADGPWQAQNRTAWRHGTVA